MSFLLILSLTVQLKSSTKRITEGSVCYTTLGIQEFSKDVTLDMGDIKNACKTITHTIKVGKGDEAQTMRYLADKMARTWWMVHEGTIEDTWNRDGWFSGADCNIVYSINIKEKKNILRKDNSIQIPAETFINFLEETTYPPKKQDNITYSQYFLENKNLAVDILPEIVPGYNDLNKDEKEITSGETYAISVISKDPGSTIVNLAYWLVAPKLMLFKHITESNFPTKQLVFSTMDFAENELGCIYQE